MSVAITKSELSFQSSLRWFASRVERARRSSVGRQATQRAISNSGPPTNLLCAAGQDGHPQKMQKGAISP